jgi:transposase
MNAHQVFSAILYVLRSGCQWKALPRKYGSASTVHRHFRRWDKAGFFQALWHAGLAEEDELEGVSWDWQRTGKALVKIPRPFEEIHNPPRAVNEDRAHASFVSQRAWRPSVQRRRRK